MPRWAQLVCYIRMPQRLTVYKGQCFFFQTLKWAFTSLCIIGSSFIHLIRTDSNVFFYTLLDSVGEGEGGMIWENGIETCIISYMKQIASQSRFGAWYRMLGAGALGWLRGMAWGGRWEGGSGWGTHVHPWWIYVDVWQNQYNIVK